MNILLFILNAVKLTLKQSRIPSEAQQTLLQNLILIYCIWAHEMSYQTEVRVTQGPRIYLAYMKPFSHCSAITVKRFV